MFIAVVCILLALAYGFIAGMTYAEANLGKRVKDVRREEGRKWWQ